MFNTIGSSITIKILDTEKRVVWEREEECKSLLRAWNRFMEVILDQSNVSIVDVDGNSKTISAPATASRAIMVGESVATNDDKGVVIGTDDTAVAIDDYCLGTKIIEGTGASQMNYLLQTMTRVESASEDYISLNRIVTNNSGSTIIVKEAGVQVWSQDSVVADVYMLILRDVLSSPASVLDGQSIDVTYKIKAVL